jgi:predicted ATPase
MDWSFDLLTGREQALFARLSVFDGSFSLEAAEEMAGDDGDGLDVFSRLVIHSLVAVERDEDSVRYRLLEPLRHYAAERLAERGEAEDVRARHAAYYLRLAEEAEDNLDGGAEQAGWFRLLELEREICGLHYGSSPNVPTCSVSPASSRRGGFSWCRAQSARGANYSIRSCATRLSADR